MRVLVLIVAILLGIVCSSAVPVSALDKDAIDTLTTVFSLFAGFVILACSLAADTTSRKKRTKAQEQRAEADSIITLNALNLILYLFLFSMITGVLIYFYILSGAENIWLGRLKSVFLFLAPFTLTLSLIIPSEIAQIQKKRYDR